MNNISLCIVQSYKIDGTTDNGSLTERKGEKK